jgi:hypothetical protein
MDSQYIYINEFIDLGVETAMRHHKFNTDEIRWYFTKQDLDSVCAERSDLDPVQNRTDSQQQP